MADLYGKLYFSWVQCSHPRIPDPASFSALSNWPLAFSRTNPNTALLLICVDLRSSAAKIGGRR